MHLSFTTDQRNGLYRLLIKYDGLFDGTLGDWNTKPLSLELKKDATPYHGKVYPTPHIYE